MRINTTVVLAGIALAACAPADGEITPIDGDIFEADAVPSDKPMDDPGFSAALEALRLEVKPDSTDDVDRRLRDAIEPDTDCKRVAYLGVRWKDASHRFKGTFYSLDGVAIAATKGNFAPVGEDGGTFAGPWARVAVDIAGSMDGPMGGIYLHDGTFFGAATYLSHQFPMRGLWERTSRFGGYGIAVVLDCG